MKRKIQHITVYWFGSTKFSGTDLGYITQGCTHSSQIIRKAINCPKFGQPSSKLSSEFYNYALNTENLAAVGAHAMKKIK